VGPTLIGLTAADLPVIFWCRHGCALGKTATAADKAGLEAIVNLATKVIVDTSGMQPVDALELLAGWQAQKRVVADLEWTRLTAWREPLAHMFDNVARENSLASFHTIEIDHSGDAPPIPALYMAGWLSAPYRANVRFRKIEASGPGIIRRIGLLSQSGTIDFERNSDDSFTLRCPSGRERKYSLSEPSITALMTEELALTGADPAFNAAFARAEELI
jgi:glucose-6-phosphate dehydrogenase assembly protein OpcA